VRSDSPLLLKLSPSLHRDLRAVKLAVRVVVSPTLRVSGRLARVSPGEVVELPERVHREDKVPDGEGEEIDEHPGDVGPAVRREHDQNRRKTKNQRQQHERDDLRRSADNRDDDCGQRVSISYTLGGRIMTTYRRRT